MKIIAMNLLIRDCYFTLAVHWTTVLTTLCLLHWTISTFQCNHNHSGTLCGSCREGYSIALGTLHCLPNFSNDYLALILSFALSGIALVAVLMLLRLTIIVGTLHGLIFYVNVVQTNTSFFFPAGEENILTVFIAWLNLDLGIVTCFYDGMTTYAYTQLQFVFPFYVWFLIGLIIVISHYSTKLTRIVYTWQ